MKTCKRKPSAHSLVEMLAAISISTVLLGIALGLVNRSISLASLSEERDRLQLTLNRLVEDLRHDLHRAPSVRISSQDDRSFELRIDAPELGVVTYRRRGEEVFREVVQTDGPVQREFYRFDDDTQFELSELAHPRRVCMKVTHRSPIAGEEPQLLTRVEIETGRFLRLARHGQNRREGTEE